MFKNKKIGFFLMPVVIVLSLILGIYFMSTMSFSMSNAAAGKFPESVALWAFLAVAMQIIAMLVPEHKFLQIGVVAAVAASWYKEVILIPPLIADVANNVYYQGGDFGTHVGYMVLLVLDLIVAIAICFLPVEGEVKAEEEKPARIGTPVVRLGGSAGLMVAIAAVGIIVSTANEKGTVVDEGSSAISEPGYVFDVAANFSDKVDADYTFDPATFTMAKEDNPYVGQSSSQISSAVGNSYNREGHNLVYKFEGAYAEGWQGDYSKHYAFMYAWDDGLFNGSSNGSNISGYWYNRADGSDEEILVLIEGNGNQMVCNTNSSKFYDWVVEVKSSLNGGRTIKAFGYKYRPTIGFYVDTGCSPEELVYASADAIDTSSWVGMRVLNDLSSAAVFDSAKTLKFAAPVDGTEANTKVVKASWKEDNSNTTYTWDVVCKIQAAA